MASWDVAAIETHAPPVWAFTLAIAGAAWLLAPRGVPLRSVGALCMAPMFLVVPPRPPPGEAWIDVLDVGNGLAIVVRTAGHALVYDAGPRWSEESDSGNRIVAPFLRGEGVRDLDLLMISHADDDHSGGAASVIATRRPKAFMSSLPPDDALWPREGISRCEAGHAWRWDDVDFQVLHPAGTIYAESAKRKENDRSCVLRIATSGHSALFTGDAEARSEMEMLLRGAPFLPADVLVIPHHGSRTSSTDRFIDAVHPALGILSVGYLNRYRHPNEAVVQRYQRRHIGLERTDQRGAVHIVLPASGDAPPELEGQEAACRYWSERQACSNR
jgi:competence protein ComEC